MSNRAKDYLDLVSGRRRGLQASLLRAGLHAFSWLYRIGVSIRNRSYDLGLRRIERVSIPVISVGNLTLGGTGKTPCVEVIARYLSDQGAQVAILSRGYGVKDGPNDEALMLEENLPEVPHLQGADRVALAGIAVEELERDVLVLDDGFQHRRLARTLDLVLIDATNPWGYGYLTPRGLLREPISGLRRAHGVILTRCDQVKVDDLERLRHQIEAQVRPATPIIESMHRPLTWLNSVGETTSPEGFAGRRARLFCGIGQPQAFRTTVEKLGIVVTEMRVFSDHHSYSRADVEGLEDWVADALPEELLLTTQKDLVKLRISRIGSCALWALRVGLEVTQGMTDLKALLGRAWPGAPA